MSIKNDQPINIISLFDGIGVLYQSLKELKIPVNNYYASEISKNSIKSAIFNHPDIKHIGDVRNVDGTKYKNVSLMAFGSPCTQLSILNRNSRATGLNGPDSGLFYEALRILKQCKPKFWIMENVASMPEKDKNIISELLGVEPIRINSALVGPALRDRLYWTNIPNVSIPEDRGIVLTDAIENGYTNKQKGFAVLTRNNTYTIGGLKRHLNQSIGNVIYLDKQFCDLNKAEKLEYLDQLKNDQEVKQLFRPITVKELCRLQTLPDNYVSTDIISKTACIKVLGDCFTLEIIKHILQHADFTNN